MANDMTTRYDPGNGTIEYLGKAAVGSSESEPVWKIKQIYTDSVGRIKILYAGNGNSNFAWTDRATLTYT